MTDLDPLAIIDGAKTFPSSPHGLQTTAAQRRKKAVSSTTPRNPAAIPFVRSRMFYARAAVNAKGKVTFGLRHIRKSDAAGIFNLKPMLK